VGSIREVRKRGFFFLFFGGLERDYNVERQEAFRLFFTFFGLAFLFSSKLSCEHMILLIISTSCPYSVYIVKLICFLNLQYHINAFYIICKQYLNSFRVTFSSFICFVLFMNMFYILICEQYMNVFRKLCLITTFI